jgi:non-ribosomal peptide synthase protein (TIGR01720 family)
VLKRVKEQMRGIPKRGLGYGLLRYMSGAGGAGARLAEGGQAEVSFNYLGQVDQIIREESPFSKAAESVGEVQSSGTPCRYLLDINAFIENGRLHIPFAYNTRICIPTGSEGFRSIFQRQLKLLIEHCQSQSNCYTPSDFPHVTLNQQELDQILKS